MNVTSPSNRRRHRTVLPGLARGSARLFLLACLVLAVMPGAPAHAQSVAPVDAQAMLKAHNQVRAQYGLGGLVWSDAMVAVAEGWARQLEANPRWCQAVIHNHERPERTGENMHATPVRSPAEASAPESIVGAWAAERQHYDLDSGTCAPGQVCGHFVQVVWAETKELGCAAALCQNVPEEGDLQRVTICNYRKGLLLGQKPF